jgi:integrase
MALLNSRTTCSCVNWNDLVSLILKLERDNVHNFSLLIAIGGFTGLRISDILALRWESLLNNDVLEVREKKTGKQRRIKINQELKDLACRIHEKIGRPELSTLIFINRYGMKAFNIQYVNVRLKQIFNTYHIRTDNPSTHTLRKSFGRRVWEKDNCSDRSLVMLSEIFNHSNIQITKRYLGIREKEIFDVYDSLTK